MQIINTETHRFPMTREDVAAEERAAGVLAVIGDGYEGHGPYRVVTPRERPNHDPLTECVVPLAPEADAEGRWSQAFAVRPMLAADIELALQADKARLLAAATAQRWAVETGGLVLPSGARIGTTVDDQNRITSVIANAQFAGVDEVDFKAATGWVTLTIDDLRGIAAAIVGHVQACFSAERAHHQAIAALGSRAAAATYDVTGGWPGL